ncbi:hypothetical protein BOTBODRAFT_102954 [Botryobasidium botryosum FD-172 SS1]|uniref:Restriction of telomere capping protein 4 n=1 Tax=Botryobasidium botryosum (strain FD-172 SS1) TaxID=930990 RepID=A0A067N5C7_BOTB1|nr:hypothetical protein BOTBODRAFT_102954 [Botryobasidium botryosum FD-172 SS1]
MDIAKKGSRVAASVRGQYDSFERTQPGYYGEQGMVVLHRALQTMFPSIPPTSCAPLEPADFILRVLIPEAARLLIAKDMNVDHKEAFTILMDSRKYGLSKFPDRESATTDLAGNAASASQWAGSQAEGSSVGGAQAQGSGSRTQAAGVKKQKTLDFHFRPKTKPKEEVIDLMTPRPKKRAVDVPQSITVVETEDEFEATPRPPPRKADTKVKKTLKKNSSRCSSVSDIEEESAPKRARAGSRTRSMK